MTNHIFFKKCRTWGVRNFIQDRCNDFPIRWNFGKIVNKYLPTFILSTRYLQGIHHIKYDFIVSLICRPRLYLGLQGQYLQLCLLSSPSQHYIYQKPVY